MKSFKHYLKEQESIYQLPSDFDIKLGSCLLAAELVTKQLLSKGITDFNVIEGWVTFKGYGPNSKTTHTWIKYNDKIIDPTKDQFKRWGFNPKDVIYYRIKKSYTPQEYLDLCDKYPIKEQISLYHPYVFLYQNEFLTDPRLKTHSNPKGLIIYSAVSEGQAIHHLKAHYSEYKYIPAGDIKGMLVSEYEKRFGPIRGKILQKKEPTQLIFDLK